MPLSMFTASVPVLVRGLTNLSAVLDKAAAHCDAKKIDPAVMLGSRLYPDMFPLSRQILIAADFGKSTPARLAGAEVPKWDDPETTFPALKARLAQASDFARSFTPAQIDGSDDRDVTISIRGNPLHFKGEAYLNTFAMPNFYFHAAMAYAILRHNGVELGKLDFLGAP